MMANDIELLRRYFEQGDEAAFTRLVERQIDLVFGTAMRKLRGNRASAEDVTQTVFADLALKAGSLIKHPDLAAWLHRSTCFAASKLIRGEQRRRLREEETNKMAGLLHAPGTEPDWDSLQPIIDNALDKLEEKDREAVLLRFFSGKRLAEIGDAIGATDNAARMRVDRALGRLRAILKEGGVTFSIPGLAAVLGAGVAGNAPAGLAATVATGALACSSSASAAFTMLFTMSKLKVSLAAGLAVLAIAIPVWQQQRVNRLTEANLELRSEIGMLAALREQVENLKAVTVDQAEEERLRREENHLQQEIARLRNTVTKSGRTEAEARRLQNALDREKARQNLFSNAITRGLATAQRWKERQVEKEIGRMKDFLDLSPNQAEAISAIRKSALQRETEELQSRMSGDASSQMPPAPSHLEIEDQVKGMLNAEQLGRYPKYKEWEATTTANEFVHSEISRLDESLRLSEAQAEALKPVLYHFRYQEVTAAPTQPISHSPRIQDAQARLHERLAAMQNILTPAQLDTFRKEQEQAIHRMKEALQILQGAQ